MSLILPELVAYDVATAGGKYESVKCEHLGIVIYILDKAPEKDQALYKDFAMT